MGFLPELLCMLCMLENQKKLLLTLTAVAVTLVYLSHYCLGCHNFQSVFRIHDILVWIRIWIRGSMPLINSDPAIYVIDLQDANQKQI
jgi:hypothetical protein